MPSPVSTTRRPSHGAIVVLLAGLMLVNLFTLTLVLTGGDKPEASADTRVAEAPAEPDPAITPANERTSEPSPEADAPYPRDTASVRAPAPSPIEDANPPRPANEPQPADAVPSFFGMPLFE